MSRHRNEVENRKWIEIPKGKWLHGCCDCRLMHWVETKIVKGELYMRWTRSKRETAYWRDRWGR
jgi:hypothetical protein